MFAGIDLAARIERAESRLIEDSAAAAMRRHPETRGFVTPIAGGVAAFATEGSPLNKVAGLGFAGPLDAGLLESVERAFAERGSPVQVELSSLAEPSIGGVLTGRGYRLRGFEDVLGRALPLDPTQPGSKSQENVQRHGFRLLYTRAVLVREA